MSLSRPASNTITSERDGKKQVGHKKNVPSLSYRNPESYTNLYRFKPTCTGQKRLKQDRARHEDGESTALMIARRKREVRERKSRAISSGRRSRRRGVPCHRTEGLQPHRAHPPPPLPIQILTQLTFSLHGHLFDPRPPPQAQRWIRSKTR